MDLQTQQVAEPFIKRLEGVDGGKPVLVGYADQGGTATDGWGNTRGAIVGKRITLDQAQADFDRNLAECDAVYDRCVKVALNSNQRAALLSFIFNEGGPHFEASTLLKVINAKQWELVDIHWREWNEITVGGKRVVDNGLVKRRAAELALWATPMGGSSPADHPATTGTAAATPPPQPTSVLQTSTGKTAAGAIVGSTVGAGSILTDILSHAPDVASNAATVGTSTVTAYNAFKSLPLVVALVAIIVVLGVGVVMLWKRNRQFQETKQ